MQVLDSDPVTFKQNNNQDLLFRARKAFESFQNDFEKTYIMPAGYKSIADFCSRILHARTTEVTKTKSGSSDSPKPKVSFSSVNKGKRLTTSSEAHSKRPIVRSLLR